MTKLLANWKSTAMGFCVLGLAMKGSVHFDVAGHLAMSARDWFGVAFGMMSAAVGMLMQDAGTTLAHTSDGVQPVSSHETPDDPAAVAVSKV